MVYLALSYDHRLVDGADAARFLTTVKERLEAGAFEPDSGLHSGVPRSGRAPVVIGASICGSSSPGRQRFLGHRARPAGPPTPTARADARWFRRTSARIRRIALVRRRRAARPGSRSPAPTSWSTSPERASATSGGPRPTSARSCAAGSTRPRSPVASQLAADAQRAAGAAQRVRDRLLRRPRRRGVDETHRPARVSSRMSAGPGRRPPPAAEEAGARVVPSAHRPGARPGRAARAGWCRLFRLGLGGKLGDGKQWMPWISLTDHVAAMRFLLDQMRSAGPVN